MEQEYPWISQQLFSVIYSHTGVHDSFLCINGLQKFSNIQIQVCSGPAGGENKALHSQGFFLSFPPATEG